MKNSFFLALMVAACVGCNAGNALAPMSESKLKSAIDKMPPKDQIAYINTMPIPTSEKAKRIAEVEQKTGYKADTSNVPKTGP